MTSEHISTARLNALVDSCASADKAGRQAARQALTKALRADGHKAGAARKLIDAWTAERRQQGRQGDVNHG